VTTPARRNDRARVAAATARAIQKATQPCASCAAKDAENERLREALTEVVATPLRYCKQVARAALNPPVQEKP
jgi:hypothetical protein